MGKKQIDGKVLWELTYLRVYHPDIDDVKRPEKDKSGTD